MNSAAHFPDGVTVIDIILRNGDVLPCYLDTSDYDKVKHLTWGATKGRNTYYADNAESGRQMHQILNPDWPLTDHRDRNGLNNRRENLRISTNQQNAANAQKRGSASSKFKGVTWEESHKSWKARIRVNNILIHLGRFKNEQDAALAYNKAAIENFGEFANLNMVSKGEK